ncbi:hypothetical protein [Halomonas alimentaria]|uniref:Uncharacterized protein n=1 Tax=Halomonas alimentaria TaxID=147248 RepID=A0A7X4W2V8_9GAMM|nr:hypothetical protein [Halomonas alimentaria]NAW33225.1 hypothetical protein [Halomonas alimentaria]
MTLLASLLLIALGGYAVFAALFDTRNHRRLWRGVAIGCLVLLILLLAGCVTREAPPPEPPPLPAPVLCAAPVGMTVQEPEPERPAGAITQRDVAAYLVELHRWGWRGWRRLSSVRAHAKACASNANDESMKEY